MARLRYNGLEAYLGATLTAAATTITFRSKLRHAGGDVPTLGAGDTITLAILGANGVPVEIVTVTAYTTGASTATITRAQEGTTAVEHLVGRRVVHNATAADFRAVEIPYTPTGTVAAVNVQAAIDEVDAEKIPLTQKAAANGVATLDAGSLLPEAQVPTRLTADQLSATYATLTTAQTITGLKTFQPAATTAVALIVQGLAAQSADLQQWQDSAGVSVARMDPSGRLGLGGAAPGASVGGQPTTLNVAGYVGLGGFRVNGADINFPIYLDTAGTFRMGSASGDVALAPGLNDALVAVASPTDGNTAIQVRRNLAGTITVQTVSMGAVDSGGVGFRTLRVPN